ncbi:MAG: OprO/OprP family phosphate-selective porin, partial [Gammaproteobacteria bacterium]
MTANVWRVWNFKLQYDFTDSTQAGFRDVYLRYLFKGAQPGQITVGKFKEPFSLEELTSSNDDMYLEQSLTEVFYPSRRIGVAGSTWGHDMWTATLGVFGEDSTVTGSQPSCGASVSASSGSISTCTGNDSEGWAVTGRLTFSPIHTSASDRVAHFGFAGSHRMPDDGDAVSFSARPESRIARDTLIATGTINGTQSVDRFGFEAAGNYGPASLQGEYFLVDVNRESAFGEDLDFDGFYVMGSWIMTGESRPYKFEDGVYQNPKPKGILGKGGWGAWELVGRYSHLDLDDDDLSLCASVSSSNTCGEEDNFTVGLNWYPTQNFKFMAHWVQ